MGVALKNFFVIARGLAIEAVDPVDESIGDPVFFKFKAELLKTQTS